MTVTEDAGPAPQLKGPGLRELADELRQRLAQVRLGGDEKARVRHVARGKLLVRDRVDRLLDPGSPFLELAPLAGWELYEDDRSRPRGLVAGIGRVEGRDCMVVANDATVKGGSYYPMTVKKHLRAQAVAAANRLPCVYLVDSRRRVPAPAGRGLPRPGALRPDLLQPGHDVERRASRSSPR